MAQVLQLPRDYAIKMWLIFPF